MFSRRPGPATGRSRFRIDAPQTNPAGSTRPRRRWAIHGAHQVHGYGPHVLPTDLGPGRDHDDRDDATGSIGEH